MSASVVVRGVAETDRYLRGLASAGQSANRQVVLVGSPLVYAYGIETGRHRGGRLARRAGGAHMLEQAIQRVQGQAAALAPILRNATPEAGHQILRALAFRVEALAKPLTPVKTGALRASITVSDRTP